MIPWCTLRETWKSFFLLKLDPTPHQTIGIPTPTPLWSQIHSLEVSIFDFYRKRKQIVTLLTWKKSKNWKNMLTGPVPTPFPLYSRLTSLSWRKTVPRRFLTSPARTSSSMPVIVAKYDKFDFSINNHAWTWVNRK